VLTDIGSYETVLRQNPDLAATEPADRIVRRIEGVVITCGCFLLECNVPRALLSGAATITPGFKSPTISALEGPDRCAARVMVKRGEVISIMERIEALGASAILDTQITNCRPWDPVWRTRSGP
jgi:ATP phosphoribosyltransferase